MRGGNLRHSRYGGDVFPRGEIGICHCEGEVTGCGVLRTLSDTGA